MVDSGWGMKRWVVTYWAWQPQNTTTRDSELYGKLRKESNVGGKEGRREHGKGRQVVDIAKEYEKKGEGCCRQLKTADSW